MQQFKDINFMSSEGLDVAPLP